MLLQMSGVERCCALAALTYNHAFTTSLPDNISISDKSGSWVLTVSLLVPACHPSTGQDSAHQPGLSPEGVTHLSQHRLVPLLLQQALAPQHSCCSLLWGHKLLSIICTPPAAGSPHHTTALPGAQAGQSHHLAPLAVHVEGPSGQPATLHCQYLVAADGAHSIVR